MKIHYLGGLALLFSSFVASDAVMAARVEIKNETDKPLTVVIPAEGNPLREDLYWLRDTIPAGATMNYEITDAQLGGKKGFSIIGDIHPLAPVGLCAPLSIYEDYKVVYQSNLIGPKCISTPLPSESNV